MLLLEMHSHLMEITTNQQNLTEEISQVKLLITSNSFCIEQRGTAQSKTGIFRDLGVAEASPFFQRLQRLPQERT
jgi:hypothetical protein